jgi:hypothetical protein
MGSFIKIKAGWFFIPVLISGLLTALHAYLSIRLGHEPTLSFLIPIIIFILAFSYAGLTPSRRNKSISAKIQPFALILSLIETSCKGGVAISVIPHYLLLFTTLIICSRVFFISLYINDNEHSTKSNFPNRLGLFVCSALGIIAGYYIISKTPDLIPFEFEYPLIVCLCLSLRLPLKDTRKKIQVSDEGIKQFGLYNKIIGILERTATFFFLSSAKLRSLKRKCDNDNSIRKTKNKELKLIHPPNITLNDIFVPLVAFLLFMLVWKIAAGQQEPQDFIGFKTAYTALLGGLTYQFRYIPTRFAFATFLVFMFAINASYPTEQILYRYRDANIGSIKIIDKVFWDENPDNIVKYKLVRINDINKAAQLYDDGQLDSSNPAGVFFKDSPIAEILKDIRPHQLAVIGADAGEISCLAGNSLLHDELNKDDFIDRSLDIEFFTRNDILKDIALNSFNYIKKCSPANSFFSGDTLYNLQLSDTTNFDAIVISDFTTHAMPKELLTLKAFESYKNKLSSQGVIAINSMDDFIDVNSAVFAAAEKLDLFILGKYKGASLPGRFDSNWLLIGHKNAIKNEQYWKTKGWTDVPSYRHLELPWTDKTNLFQYIHPFGNPKIKPTNNTEAI